jgi:hypothetical protein
MEKLNWQANFQEWIPEETETVSSKYWEKMVILEFISYETTFQESKQSQFEVSLCKKSFWDPILMEKAECGGAHLSSQQWQKA